MAHRNMQWIQSHIFLLYKLPKAVQHVYELALAKQLLSATVGVFIPLYIYIQTRSLLLPILYVTLARGVFSIPILLLVTRLMEKIGIERVMYIGVLALVMESAAALLPLNTLTFILLALFEGLSQVTYWSAFHYAFGIFGKKREVTEEVAGLSVLLSTITIVAPLFMGVLVVTMGFHNAFLTLLIVGIGFATYLVKHFDKVYRVKTNIKKILKPPFVEVSITAGIYLFAPMFIGLYAYSLGRTVEGFSLFLSMVGLASAIISLFVASLVDHKKEFWLALVEPAVSCALFSLYPFVQDIFVLFFMEIVRQLGAAWGVAIYGALYNAAKKWPEILLGRNLYIYVGRAIAGTLIIALGPTFKSIFTIGVIGAILYMLTLKRMIKDVEKLTAGSSF